jgi:hypothetical protein
VAIERTRKNKENPHYNFLISWQPKDHPQARVKGESNLDKITAPATFRHSKRAESSAQEAVASGIKKNIVRSLILIGLILILELVIYLAWNKFIIK